MASKEKDWPNDFRRIVAQNLKRLRARLDITADDLADRTGPEGEGLTGGYIRQLETGNTWVSDKSLGILAKGLNAKPGELLIDLKSDLRPTPEEALAIVSEALRSRSAPVNQDEVAPEWVNEFMPVLGSLSIKDRAAALVALKTVLKKRSADAKGKVG